MIEINNLSNFRLDKKLFTGIAKKVLSGENRRTETLSLVFISKEEIKKLNKKYRGKNKPTDVLSFSAQGGPAWGGEAEKKILGEIIICPEIVKEKKEDIKKVFIHGILHLLGYDHEKSLGRSAGEAKKEAEVMEQKEEKYSKF